MAAGKATSIAVRVESGPVFELLAIATATLNDSHHANYDLGEPWFDRLATDAPETLAKMRAFAGGSVRVWDHVLGFVLDAGSPFEVANVVAHLKALTPQAVLLDLLGRHNRPVQRVLGQELIERAAAGDSTAQHSFLRLAWPDEDGWQDGLRQLFAQTAEETRGQLVDLLGSLNAEIVPRVVAPVLPALEADAAEKRAAAQGRDALALIRFALDTGYVPTADVLEVVLVPSFVVRPYFYFIEHADQLLFLYPLPDGAAESVGAGPPGRLVKLTNALGDRVRLEVLAALKDRELSIRQLGEHLDLPRSTLRHHLSVLRMAGLIRPVQAAGGFSSYSFRREAVEDVTALLRRYLGA
jgi:DNA-binding transcriptional ArsR family regulator